MRTWRVPPAGVGGMVMLCLFIAGLAWQAHASKPVARTIVGCVTDAQLTSEGGYEITVVRNGMGRIDLGRWNGLRIRFDGMLLPGDRLMVRSDPVVLGPCPEPPPPARERKGRP